MNVSIAGIPAAADRDRRSTFLISAVLALLVVLAWSNSFRAPFELDDRSSIQDNPSIRDLASFRWLSPPSAHGETVGGRPVVNLSLAVNHALGGDDVRGYHVVNLLVHVIAALVLFGVVRRTLLLPVFSRRFESSARSIALAAAAIWSLHPLQTEAVTYVIQRAQSLEGLFLLLTLYGFIRGYGASDSMADPRGTGSASRWWIMLSIGASALGMATKEDMVVAPVVVLLYDRTFVAGSFAAALRQRRGYYCALAATWLVLVGLVATNTNRGGSAGFGSAITPVAYGLTQVKAWCHYLALVLWPSSLVFDYGTPTVASVRSVLPQFAVVGILFAGTAWALWRNRISGFLGACFCLALLPSSSVIPVATQTIAEHRMYLALAPVAVAFVMVAYRLPRAYRFGMSAAVVAALAVLTLVRNHTYSSAVSLWRDTVAKAPENARAHNNLGLALRDADENDGALAEYRRALAIQPNHAFARNNLGVLLLARGDCAAAAEQFAAAVTADAHFTDARVNWGVALLRLGRPDAAAAQFRAVLQDQPHAADAQTNLAAILQTQGESKEAESLIRDALSTAPNLAEAHLQYGHMLEARSPGDAEAEYRAALRLRPDLAAAQLALGNLLAAHHDLTAAATSYREAIRLDPRAADAWYGLGNVLAQQRRFDEAMQPYNEALRLDPDHLDARANRANCELVTGNVRAAIADYEAVLRLRPADSNVTRNLQIARQLLSGASP